MDYGTPRPLSPPGPYVPSPALHVKTISLVLCRKALAARSRRARDEPWTDPILVLSRFCATLPRLLGMKVTVVAVGTKTWKRFRSNNDGEYSIKSKYDRIRGRIDSIDTHGWKRHRSLAVSLCVMRCSVYHQSSNYKLSKCIIWLSEYFGRISPLGVWRINVISHRQYVFSILWFILYRCRNYN